MGKKLRFWTGAAIGAALQYLYDPKAGPSRRALLRDQFTDWALDTRDGVVGKKLSARALPDSGRAGLRPSQQRSRLLKLNHQEATHNQYQGGWASARP